MTNRWRTVLIAMVAAGAVGAAAALLVRDQISRHQRGLFSPRRLERLAALGHFAQRVASIDDLNVLRDYVAREPIRALRLRASGIIERMEQEVARLVPSEGI